MRIEYVSARNMVNELRDQHRKIYEKSWERQWNKIWDVVRRKHLDQQNHIVRTRVWCITLKMTMET